MKLIEILGSSSGIAIIVLTIIQITPIKINPWSFIWDCIKRVVKAIVEYLNHPVINRMDKMNASIVALDTKFNNLEKKVDSLESKEDEKDAIDARNRILIFGDDLMHGILHSKGSYDQVLSDISFYNDYCDKHPYFKNNVTSNHARLIENRYMAHLDNNDFLQ